MTWSGPDEDNLRKLAAEGLSGGQIGDRIGKSRSAVCGKAWRLGIPLGGEPQPGGLGAVRARRCRANGRKKKSKPFVLFNQMGLVDKNAPVRIRADGFVPQVFPPAPEHQRKTVETLEEVSCRWPIGDPQHADFHFCGAEKIEGLPYCSEHCRVAFQSPQVRRPIHDPTPVPAFQTEDA